MKTPKLSICIPTYNRSYYLDRLLSGVLISIPKIQNKEIEVVILDNCSIDNTLEICEKYSNFFTNFSYFRNSRNIGGPPNIAKVASCASAKYVWIIGDDDHIDRDVVLGVLEEIDLAANGLEFGLLILNTRPYQFKDNDFFSRFKKDKNSREVFLDKNIALNSVQDNIQWISCQVLNKSLRQIGCDDAISQGFYDPHVYGALYAMANGVTIIRRDLFVYAGGDVPADHYDEPPEVKKALKLSDEEHPWISVFFDTQKNSLKYSEKYGFDNLLLRKYRWRIDRQLIRVFGTHKFTGSPDNSNVPLKRFMDLLSFSSSRSIFLMVYCCPQILWRFGYGFYRATKKLIGLNSHT